MILKRINQNVPCYVRSYSSVSTAVVEPTLADKKALAWWLLVDFYFLSTFVLLYAPRRCRLASASPHRRRLALSLEPCPSPRLFLEALKPHHHLVTSPHRRLMLLLLSHHRIALSLPPHCFSSGLATRRYLATHCNLTSASLLRLQFAASLLPRLLVVLSPACLCLAPPCLPWCFVAVSPPPGPLPCASVFLSCFGDLPSPLALLLCHCPSAHFPPYIPYLPRPRPLSTFPSHIFWSLLLQISASAPLASAARLSCLLLCFAQAQNLAYTADR